MANKSLLRETVKYPAKFSVVCEELTVEEKKKLKVNEGIKIRGIGIVPTVSENGIKYELPELAQSWPTMEGEIITMNHTRDVTDAVGVINKVYLDDGGKGIYEAIVYNTSYHPDAIEMVRKGLIKYVSIEADTDLVHEEADVYRATNLEFTGLAFVRTPGIKETTVAIAEALGAIKKNKRRQTMSEEQPEQGAAPQPEPQAGEAPKEDAPEAKPEGAEAKPEGEAEAKPEAEAEKKEGEAPAQESTVAKLMEEMKSLKATVSEMQKVQEKSIAEAVTKVLEKKGDKLHNRPLAESKKEQKNVLESVDVTNLSVTDIVAMGMKKE